MKTDGAGNLSFDTVDLTNLSASNLTSGTVPIDRLGTSGTKDATTFLRGDNTFAEAGGGDNLPTFSAYISSNQIISHNTLTKLDFDAENFDSDGNFDTSTNEFTIPTGKGGYWFFSVRYGYDNTADFRFETQFYKNGSTITWFKQHHDDDDDGTFYSVLLNLTAGDTISVYTKQNQGGNQTITGTASDNTLFFGFRLVQ